MQQQVHILAGEDELNFEQVWTILKEELESKSEKQLKTVHDKLEEFFRNAPLYAVVNESVYCAYGGIPDFSYFKQTHNLLLQTEGVF